MDEQKAASILRSIENDDILLQSITNNTMHCVGLAATENMCDGGNAGLTSSTESLFTKAATYNDDNNNYCMQMGSTGAPISSTYGTMVASPVSELTSMNPHSIMDTEMIHGRSAGQLTGNGSPMNNYNGGTKCNNSDSYVESEASKVALTTSSPGQSFAMCRGQAWPLIGYDDAGGSMNGSDNATNGCSSGSVNGSNGVINNAGITDDNRKSNMDASAKLANSIAGIISGSNNGTLNINGSSSCSMNGNANGGSSKSASVINSSSNGVNGNIKVGENINSSTSGSYNGASAVNGNNNGAAMICMNSSTVNARRKRSRSAPWSVAEMLALIDAKRSERQRSMSYKTRGLKLPGVEKWKLVSRYLESKEMERSGSQCQDKWENMMKDYKAVRDWQTQHCNAANDSKDEHPEGGHGRNYFKHMTNKERKEARLPPQMDEAIFSSLHTIQHEKEEHRRISSIGSSSLPKPKPTPPLSSSSASLITDSQVYHHPKVHHNFPLDIPHGSQHLNLNTHLYTAAATDHPTMLHAPPATTHSDNNMQHKNDPVSRIINTHKEEITCTTQILQENLQENKASCNRLPTSPQQLTQHPQDGSQAEHIKETASLVQVLVALADAVKTVAQKL